MRAIVRFGKQARLRFISHLDLQRFFQMALNRTGLPIAYTQGFNPHAVMAFGSALALGWTSEYEMLDFKLAAPMGRKRVEECIRAALPIDLPVYEVKLVDDRHPALMAQVVASDYTVYTEDKAILDAIPTFLSTEHVYGIKKSKSGEKEIDLRPLVIDLKRTEVGFKTCLKLTEQDSLKPDLLWNALAKLTGKEPTEVRIHRTALLGLNGDKALVPLMEL